MSLSRSEITLGAWHVYTKQELDYLLVPVSLTGECTISARSSQQPKDLVVVLVAVDIIGIAANSTYGNRHFAQESQAPTWLFGVPVLHHGAPLVTLVLSIYDQYKKLLSGRYVLIICKTRVSNIRHLATRLVAIQIIVLNRTTCSSRGRVLNYKGQYPLYPLAVETRRVEPHRSRPCYRRVSFRK